MRVRYLVHSSDRSVMMKMKHIQILIPLVCFDGDIKQGLNECKIWRKEKKQFRIVKQSRYFFAENSFIPLTEFQQGLSAQVLHVGNLETSIQFLFFYNLKNMISRYMVFRKCLIFPFLLMRPLPTIIPSSTQVWYPR